MNNDFYKKILKLAPIGYAYHKIIVDNFGNPCDYEFLDINREFEKLTGIKSENVIGKKISVVQPGILDSNFDWISCYGEVALKGGAKEIVQYSEMQEKWYKIVVFSDRKNYFVTLFFDVTNIEKMENDLLRLTQYDYLTGAYNRQFFEKQYTKLNTQDNFPLALIIGDINGLKIINESYGLTAGDNLIIKVYEELKLLLNHDATLGRIGGDEFAILMINETLSSVKEFANFLEDRMNKNVHLTGSINSEMYLSVSFGYGIQEHYKQGIETLIKESEKHMYRRKFCNEKSVQNSILRAMISALFVKSEREKRHSERVSLYSVQIAKALNWDNEKVSSIGAAGVLHDIGKIGISEAILNKKGKLDEREWAEMKLHANKSQSILKEFDEYAEISNIVFAHHERWDGKGYPLGLKNEQIPIASRIIAVADAYDAMIEQREYRKPLSINDAISELKKNSGTQFDPEIVEVFVDKVLGENG